MKDGSNDRDTQRVTVIYKNLPHYRVAFFDKLRDVLAEHDVELNLVVGQPDSEWAARRDNSQVAWAVPIRNRHLSCFGRQLIWQPALPFVRPRDLVIVEQASRLLINYVLLVWSWIGGPRFAWWGHGQNRDEANASRMSERLKAATARLSDWWFCYTEGTARLVESFGVDRSRTTVVQNTTDTESLRRARRAMTPERVATVRAELGIGNGPVAVSIGSIYPTKRPDFLLEAADHLRRMVPGFELIVIGDGPDRHLLDDAASSRPWLHVLGALHGDDLARSASPALVLLNPGLVGLTIVDTFALGLPMVTCELPYHSPEIEYLDHEVNGLMLSDDTTSEQYAKEVANLLACPSRLEGLSRNAAKAAERYTIDEMVRRFADGVLAALPNPGADEPIARRWRRPRSQRTIQRACCASRQDRPK